jgi:putative salt-induced outer membrane protein YdiY
MRNYLENKIFCQLQWWIVTALVLLLMPDIVSADEVWLKNGNHLTGKIIKLEDEKLVIKTSFAGELRIDWEAVSGIETDEPVLVETVDSRHIRGSVTQSADQTATLSGAGGSTVIPLDSITSIQYKGKKALTSKGDINASIDIQEGNTDKDRYDLDFEIHLYWKEINHFTIGGDATFERSEGKTTVDKESVHLEYDRFLLEKIYIDVNSLSERDEFKDIRFRNSTGVALGYQWLKTGRTNLSIELGPGYAYEDSDTEGINKWAVARWKASIRHWLWMDRLQLYHDDWLYMALGSDRHYVITETGLKFPIFSGFNCSLQYDWDWDNETGEENENIDSRLKFKLGYSW